MTPTSESLGKLASNPAEERARDRALTLWRLRGSGDEFPIYLQLCCEVENLNEELNLVSEQRDLAVSEMERMKRELAYADNNFKWRGHIIDQLNERLRDLESQKGQL